MIDGPIYNACPRLVPRNRVALTFIHILTAINEGENPEILIKTTRCFKMT